MSVLECERLVRTFDRGRFLAVDDLSLSLGAGEVHGLLGPNGAGKTTTVRMCATLLTPDRGQVVVVGIDAVRRPERARRELGLVLGGDLGFYPRASARDNLLFFADVAGVSSRARRDEVDRVLARVALSDRADEKVGSYSRGMKQRLHVARALLGRPPLLPLDEPTTGSDPDSALQVRDLVRELAEDGAAILLTSHSLPEVEELATVITVIGAGRVAVRGKCRMSPVLPESGPHPPSPCRPVILPSSRTSATLCVNLERPQAQSSWRPGPGEPCGLRPSTGRRSRGLKAMWCVVRTVRPGVRS